MDKLKLTRAAQARSLPPLQDTARNTNGVVGATGEKYILKTAPALGADIVISLGPPGGCVFE